MQATAGLKLPRLGTAGHRVRHFETKLFSQTFPTRTEGSVKKHWYKVRLATRLFRGRARNADAIQDMHYAEFAEDEVCLYPHHLSRPVT